MHIIDWIALSLMLLIGIVSAIYKAKKSTPIPPMIHGKHYFAECAGNDGEWDSWDIWKYQDVATDSKCRSCFSTATKKDATDLIAGLDQVIDNMEKSNATDGKTA